MIINISTTTNIALLRRRRPRLFYLLETFDVTETPLGTAMNAIAMAFAIATPRAVSPRGMAVGMAVGMAAVMAVGMAVSVTVGVPNRRIHLRLLVMALRKVAGLRFLARYLPRSNAPGTCKW
jgi:hypothetical protein